MRSGLPGTGFWAAETHAPALALHPGPIRRGWGRDQDKAEMVARRYSVLSFADLDDLLGAGAVSAASLGLTVPLAATQHEILLWCLGSVPHARPALAG